MIPWWKIDIEDQDKAAVISAMDSCHYSLGPVTQCLETAFAKMLNVKYAVAVNNGSAALLMSLMALGIGPGDEVIVPNRTWIATAHAVKMVGAEAVFCDVQENVPIIDLDAMHKKITRRTRGIIPVSLNGRSVAIDRIHQLAKEYNLFVIEDACQALLSKESNKFYIGTRSHCGCFSFSMAKLLPTGQGGCIVTNDDNLYERLLLIRTQGVSDLINCHQFHTFGFNFRITDLQSALALSQLGRLDKRKASLVERYQYYETGLKKLEHVKLIPSDIAAGEVPLYIEVLVMCSRNKIVSQLKEYGIETRPFYPNLNSADYFNDNSNYPNANVFSKSGLVLPCGPNQSFKNIDYVVALLHELEMKVDCYE